jgi:hypothetical protein
MPAFVVLPENSAQRFAKWNGNSWSQRAVNGWVRSGRLTAFRFCHTFFNQQHAGQLHREFGTPPLRLSNVRRMWSSKRPRPRARKRNCSSESINLVAGLSR